MDHPSFARLVRVVPGAFLAAALLLFTTTPGFAQEGAIAGTVVDEQSLQPLEGAQVFIPDLGIGALTDVDGRYRLTGVPAGQVTVRVQVLGYRTLTRGVTVQAGQVTTADFQLSVSAVQLEDVVVNVVTGLERRKRELGANVSEIRADEVNKGSITSVDQFLSGRAEGVVLSVQTGDVGAASKIRIRGSNSLTGNNNPLIFIDGIQVTNSFFANSIITSQEPNRLNDLNPEDIASIEVVKGPAASALYGAVGANGVILITTKRGQAGRTQWHAYAEGAVQNDVTEWPDNFGAFQVIGDPSAPLYTEDGLNRANFLHCPNLFAGLGFCTQDVFSTFNTLEDPRTTPYTEGDIVTYGGNISGGSDVATYFISGELNDTQGVIFFNEEDKVTTRLNLDAGVLDNLNTSLSVGYTDKSTVWISDSNSIFSPIIMGLLGSSGFAPGTADNGGPNRANYPAFSRNLQDLVEASPSEEDVRRFTGSANASWQPLSWLSARGNFGLDLLDQASNITIQPGLDDLAEIWVIGFRQADRGTRQNWTANASVSAGFDLTDEITSSTTLGGSFQEELFRNTLCFGAGLLPGTASCASTTTLFAVDEAFLNVVTLGAFAQQEFSLWDRLFVTGSVRLDDNSNFGGQSEAELYPAANVSYVISEEDWFPSGGFLTELRLRGGYGEAGSRPGFRDAITRFAPVTVTVEGENVAGVTLSEQGNEQLKAERTREFEGGFDAGLLNDRVGLQFTYFQKTSSDALVRRRIAPSFGTTSTLLANLGEVRNRGTELSLRVDAVNRRNFRANFLGQFTTLDNEVLDLGEGVEPIILGGQNVQRHQEGLPAGSYVNPPFTFQDANGDGYLTPGEVTLSDVDCSEGDVCFVNESTPTWTSSLTADLEFFQFLSFSTLVEARGGHGQQNDSERFRCLIGLGVAGAGCLATGGGPGNLEDQANLNAVLNGSFAGYVEDAWFVKWREFSVTLSAPPALASKHRLLERSSLTFAGRNLATITDYTGLDPEVNETGASSGTGGFRQEDFNTQPPLRIFTARLDLRF